MSLLDAKVTIAYQLRRFVLILARNYAMTRGQVGTAIASKPPNLAVALLHLPHHLLGQLGSVADVTFWDFYGFKLSAVFIHIP